VEEPWFTGPLIAPVGTAVPYGEFLIKSYLFCSANTGVYNRGSTPIPTDNNFYSTKSQFLCFFGLNPWCDINISPEFYYNYFSGERYFYPGDLTVGLDFQLMSDKETPYFPGIKFSVREVLPTGNFQYLRPRKLWTDRTGAGTFGTQFDLVLYKEFHLSGAHFLSTTVSGEYTVNTHLNVHGFNAYGGGFGAKGKVFPGNRFQGIVSFEVSLTQHWSLALDTVYSFTEATTFSGNPGIAFSGLLATVGSPSAKQVSFAPAIEYNFSKKMGLIAGCHLSAWGKNSPEFRSGVVNFTYKY